VSKVPNVYGVGLFGDTTSGDAFLLNWIWSSGARTFDSTYSKVTLNNEKGLAGLKFLKTMIDEKLANPGAAGIKASDTFTLFNQQKVATVQAATINYARTVQSMEKGELNKFDIMLAMTPNAPGEKPTTFLTTFGFAVFKNEDPDKQKWAIEFAKFLASKENAGAVKAAQSFSPRKSMVGLYNDSSDENMKFAEKMLNYAIDGGVAAPGFNQQRAIFAKKVQAVFTNTITPEQALKEFEEEANKVIAEERARYAKQ